VFSVKSLMIYTFDGLHAGAELGLFIRGVKINITIYNICSVVVVET
jgi:hypothetical protein